MTWISVGPVARAFTVAFEGVEARIVEVQCAIAPGMPYFGIVGLPDKAVSEAKERVRAALTAMGLALAGQLNHRDRQGHMFPRQLIQGRRRNAHADVENFGQSVLL